MERTQFTFYDSFFRAISRIKKKADKADAYNAICAYALYGEEPDMDSLPDAAAIAFELVKPNLDSARRKAENGQKGGSKTEANGKQTASKAEANGKQTASKAEANGKQTGSKKENKIENKKEIEYECKESIKKSSRFSPPTLDEVRAYCVERGNNVDAGRFIDFYASKGWKVGNQPMKDWKAAVRTWEQRDGVSKKADPVSSAPDASDIDRNAKAFARIRGE